MSEPRRRVDFTGLPKWQQYILGASVAAIVVGVIWASGGQRSAPGWFLLAIEIAAVVLLVGGVAWLARRLSGPR
jgi:hypothetical protein